MTQRTPAITGFAVLSIGLGSFFAIMSLYMVALGTTSGAAVEAMGSNSAYASFVWLGCAAINALLVAAGVGLLKGHSWGRSLALAYGALSLVVNGSWLYMSDFNALPAAAMIYTAALVAMCMSPQWRAALCGACSGECGSTTAAQHTHSAGSTGSKSEAA